MCGNKYQAKYLFRQRLMSSDMELVEEDTSLSHSFLFSILSDSSMFQNLALLLPHDTYSCHK